MFLYFSFVSSAVEETGEHKSPYPLSQNQEYHFQDCQFIEIQTTAINYPTDSTNTIANLHSCLFYNIRADDGAAFSMQTNSKINIHQTCISNCVAKRASAFIFWSGRKADDFNADYLSINSCTQIEGTVTDRDDKGKTIFLGLVIASINNMNQTLCSSSKSGFQYHEQAACHNKYCNIANNEGTEGLIYFFRAAPDNNGFYENSNFISNSEPSGSYGLIYLDIDGNKFNLKSCYFEGNELSLSFKIQNAVLEIDSCFFKDGFTNPSGNFNIVNSVESSTPQDLEFFNTFGCPTEYVYTTDTETTPEDTEKTPEDTEKTPENTEKTPENTEKTPENTEKTPENTEKTPENTEKTPENTEKTPEDTKTTSTNTIDQNNAAKDETINGNDKDKSNSSVMYIGIGCACAVVVIIAILVFIIIKRRKPSETLETLDADTDPSIGGSDHSILSCDETELNQSVVISSEDSDTDPFDNNFEEIVFGMIG